MRPASLILVAIAALLSLTAILYPASAYIYHMPVIVDSSLSPEVLMPGDFAMLTIELRNGAADYGAGDESKGMTLSTPVNRTTLTGSDQIQVLSSSNNYNVGMIGPKDVVVLFYNIKASDGIPDGNYFLDFKVEAGYESEEITRQIPVKVDSTTLSISRAEMPENGEASLDVANPRQNTLNAVTVIPEGKGVDFSPEKYYIGTMKPDEIFTIDFDLSSQTPLDNKNLSFKSIFKNGDTWHESEPYNMTFKAAASGSRQNPATSAAPGGMGAPRTGSTAYAAVIVLLVAVGGLYFRQRRKNKP